MQAAGNRQPILLNRVGNPGRIGFDRAQVAEGPPSLRLADREGPEARFPK
jgi:hypothetical protein